MSAPLFDHQAEGIAFLKERPVAGLFDDPGLGKSRQALEAALEPILVVAPAMVLDSGTWDDEVAAWAPGAEVVQMAYSSLVERSKTANNGSRPTTTLRPELRREWGTVILDESHYIKSRGKKEAYWTTALRKLWTERLYQLTGTPIPNWAHEAFNSLQFMYPDEAGKGQRFGSYWRWVKEWFATHPGRFAPVEIGGLREDRSWDEFQAANWGDRMLRRLREDCLDLPPLTIQEWRLPMVPKQRKAYLQMKRDFITWLDGAGEVTAWSQPAKLVKLAQLATGLEVVDPTSPGSNKLDALETLLTDRPRPTLVTGHFRATVRECARRARALGLEVGLVDGGVSRSRRGELVKAFKAGNLQVLCATLDTISEGMTLTAADLVIRVERSWRPSRNDQVVRRLHRIGQERPVHCVDLISRDTVDERVLKLLTAKTDQQMKALPAATLRELV